jgi:protein phosphatase
MSLILHTVTATDIGHGRTNNEDSAFAGRRLVAVADGIGGMPAGELASDIAIKALAVLEDNPNGGDPLALLRSAVERANRQIRAKTDADTGRDGMGTTVTALLLSTEPDGREVLGLLNVGDSRTYLFRDDALVQVTKDDTFVQTLVDEGVLSARDARTHPRRSVVTQALQGMEYTATCELLTPRAGDRYLLCSDGLSDVVEDADIASVLRDNTDLARCARRLVRLALEAGAPDNVTVALADIAVG